jgi:hypothetical protein
MSSTVEEFTIYQISNAPLRTYPYPHIYVENVFPDDYYAALRQNWPEDSELMCLADSGRVSKGAYPDRYILPFTDIGVSRMAENRRPFWQAMRNWLMANHFLTSMIHRFGNYVQERFGDDITRCQFEADSLLVRDKTNYAIGPHTDAPHRLLSLLFYCPDDDRLKHLGTSIYAPLDPEFTCEGGPHYPHEKFKKIVSMDFKPNSLFAFVKTNRSFHGLGRIEDQQVARDMLLYDVRVFNLKNQN